MPSSTTSYSSTSLPSLLLSPLAFVARSSCTPMSFPQRAAGTSSISWRTFTRKSAADFSRRPRRDGQNGRTNTSISPSIGRIACSSFYSGKWAESCAVSEHSVGQEFASLSVRAVSSPIHGCPGLILRNGFPISSLRTFCRLSQKEKKIG